MVTQSKRGADLSVGSSRSTGIDFRAVADHNGGRSEMLEDYLRLFASELCFTVTRVPIPLLFLREAQMNQSNFENNQSTNPYAPPLGTLAAGLDSGDDAELVRRAHLSHEVSIKAIGLLYMLGFLAAVMGLVLVAGGMAEVFSAETDNAREGAMIGTVIGLLYMGLGALQGLVGLSLRRFKNWARIVASVFSVFGLIAFPIGTIISAYFLYLLLSAKGKFIFTDQYRQIVAATPHIRYKTHIAVWIVLAIVLAILITIIGSLFLSPR